MTRTEKTRSAHSRFPEAVKPTRLQRPARAVAIVLATLLLAVINPPAPYSDGIPGGGDQDTTDITGSVKAPPAGQREILPAATKPFSEGEMLRFSVQYGFVKAGQAFLEVPEVKNYDGHEVYTLRATAKSNLFFSVFYKVRNNIESYWDRKGHFSRRFHEDRHEGGYKKKEEIVFEYDRSEAKYSDGEVFLIPPTVQDALSSFYYTRFQELPIGGSIIFDYHASKKNKPLEIKVLGRETVNTPAGKFECVAIEPILKAGGIFKKNGRLVIWLTDDERRMPVMMKSKVTIGSISVILQEAKFGA